MAFRRFAVMLLALVCQLSGAVSAAEVNIKLVSTTSTESSGILGYLIPLFKKDTGIGVHVIALGTGMALKAAERGDADLLMVHHVESELAFVEAGLGHSRRPFMFNDFIVVGPKHDPANIKAATSVTQVMKQLHRQDAIFVSRADDSGTHKREKSLWRAAGLDPHQGVLTYREVGSGMGKTLNIAAALNGYTLTDRGTWLSFRNRQQLTASYTNDPLLFNQYSVIEINAGRHPHVKAEAARAFSDWLISDKGQAAIGAFRVNGEQLFIPNYKEAVSGQ